MNTEDAIEDYRKLTCKLAKAVSQLSYIRDRMNYINTEMEWDGLFEVNFDTALRELAEVESAAIIYTLEDEFENDENSANDNLNNHT